MDISIIIAQLPQARSITHLANLLGIPRSTLRDSLVKLNLPTDNIDSLKIATGAGAKPIVAITKKIEDLVKIAELKRAVSQANQQYEFTIEVPSEPVVFILWGDLHIGGAGVNHTALLSEMNSIKTLREQDNSIVLALNGDLIDGYIKGSGHANNEQVLDLDEQRAFATYVITELQPELTLSADHEAWSITSGTEINFTKDVCTKENLNYAQWQAKLTIKMDNGVTKSILVNHRYPGKTAMNPTKHLSKLHTERGPADIVCCGHYHSNPGAYNLHPLRQNEDKFLALQNGTYKIGDGFGMKINDYQGEYGIPAALILPNGNVMGFDHYSEAVAYKEQLLK